ncbi:MAG: hypothetical protein R3208_13110 [Ketobacteraceae bacterium]|nr:hypothetical protein [Ketobacteraceae bacterium]
MEDLHIDLAFLSGWPLAVIIVTVAFLAAILAKRLFFMHLFRVTEGLRFYYGRLKKPVGVPPG